MPPRTPHSQTTLRIAEAALRKVIQTYHGARPEEFRWVSEGFAGQYDKPGVPLALNGRGNALDYRINLDTLLIDVAPADPDLGSPIPPDGKTLQVAGEFSMRFKDERGNKQFGPTIVRFFLLFKLKLIRREGMPYFRMILKQIRLDGLEPDPLRLMIEHSMSLILDRAIRQIEVPAEFNTQDLVSLVITHFALDEDTIRVHAAVDLGDHEPEF